MIQYSGTVLCSSLQLTFRVMGSLNAGAQHHCKKCSSTPCSPTCRARSFHCHRLGNSLTFYACTILQCTVLHAGEPRAEKASSGLPHEEWRSCWCAGSGSGACRRSRHAPSIESGGRRKSVARTLVEGLQDSPAGRARNKKREGVAHPSKLLGKRAKVRQLFCASGASSRPALASVFVEIRGSLGLPLETAFLGAHLHSRAPLAWKPGILFPHVTGLSSRSINCQGHTGRGERKGAGVSRGLLTSVRARTSMGLQRLRCQLEVYCACAVYCTVLEVSCTVLRSTVLC